MFGPVEIQGLSGLINVYVINVYQLARQSQFYLVVYYCEIIYACIIYGVSVCVCVSVCVLRVGGLVSLRITLLSSSGLLLPILANPKE